MARDILIVYHTQSGNTEAAAREVAEGVKTVEGAEPVLKLAGDAGTDDLVSCAAACFGTPDYMGYMAGMMKDFFDKTQVPAEGKVNDKPYGIFMTYAGKGGGAVESVQTMCRVLKMKEAAEPVRVKNAPDEDAKRELRKLGAAVASA
ncbi:flavodoxin family protein [Planctomycetota bacterium]